MSHSGNGNTASVWIRHAEIPDEQQQQKNNLMDKRRLNVADMLLSIGLSIPHPSAAP